MLLEAVVPEELEAVINVVVDVLELLQVAVVSLRCLLEDSFEDGPVEAEVHLYIIEEGLSQSFPKQ
jgi:hypothetical protein